MAGPTPPGPKDLITIKLSKIHVLVLLISLFALVFLASLIFIDVNNFIRHQITFANAVKSRALLDDVQTCIQTYPHFPQRSRCYNVTNPNFASQKEIEQWEQELRSIIATHGLSVDTVLMKWLEPHAKDIDYSVAPIGTSQYCIVAQESRLDPVFPFTVKHTLHLLGPGWSVVLFHSAENKMSLIKELDIRPGGKGRNIELFEATNIPVAHSSLPLSSEYFSKVPCENIIVIQHDVIMRKSTYLESTISDSKTLFEIMEQSDFLGGPWRDEEPIFIGNGGCSYRRRSTMIRAITHKPIVCSLNNCTLEDEYDNVIFHNMDRFWEFNEDWVLERLLRAEYHSDPQKYWRMGKQTSAVMAKFSASDVQALLDPDPYFTHKLWVNPNPEISVKLFAPLKQYYVKPQTYEYN